LIENVRGIAKSRLVERLNPDLEVVAELRTMGLLTP